MAPEGPCHWSSRPWSALPCCIKLASVAKRILQKWQCVTSQGKSQKTLHLLLWIVYPGKTSRHVMKSPTTLWRHPCNEELRSPANVQHQLTNLANEPPWKRVLIATQTFRWCRPPSLQNRTLRPQTSWSRDKGSLLCPIWINDQKSHARKQSIIIVVVVSNYWNAKVICYTAIDNYYISPGPLITSHFCWI